MLKVSSLYFDPFYKKLYLFCIVLLMVTVGVKAEGSKDLYPSGVQGNRAFLYSNISTNPVASSIAFPFRTLGTHYVYAKVNEYITLASSAQGKGNGSITITSPSGLSQTITDGLIVDRTEELAGPLYRGQAAGSRCYTPHYFDVNEEGVWRVEFNPTGDATSSGIASAQDVYANGSWTQGNNNSLIAAWDISVRSVEKNSWMSGRVYTNVLNLFLSDNLNKSEKAYYGTNYVLTKDGRAYRVKNNGSHGLGFTFFSNNKGFIDASGKPTYKSSNSITADVVRNTVHDPRYTDNSDKNLITHKLFYAAPAEDLPESAGVTLYGMGSGRTWLKQRAVVPVVTGIHFYGSENLSPNQSSQKGGFISFDANVAGTYRITIPVSGAGRDKVITGAAVAGNNMIRWEGRDGKNDLISAGQFSPQIKVQLASAEVHFPFLDMEINPGGIIIELAENTTKYLINPIPGVIDESVYSDRVYWDDSDITGGAALEKSNPQVNRENGLSSNLNGHKWGGYNANTGSGNNGTGSSSYGNEKGMDTYAYILSNERIEPLSIEVKVADLKILSLVPSATKLSTGNRVSYDIQVKNEGPSDVEGAKFQFVAPTGFTITDAVLASSSCAVESSRNLQNLNFSSTLSLKNGCVITYTISGTIGSEISGLPIRVEANILRPADVTDPDATNTVFDQKPLAASTECTAVSTTVSCNNIKFANVVAQELCAGSPIVSIVYTAAPGGIVNNVISGLPNGLTVSSSPSRNTLTITGTPTSSGTFTLETLNDDTEKTTYVIQVNPLPVIHSIPTEVFVCEGQNTVISVGSPDTNNSYKWQYSDNGTTWIDVISTADIQGISTKDLILNNVPKTINGRLFRVILSSPFSCTTTSAPVKLTVNNLPDKVVISPLTKVAFCEGFSATLTASSVEQIKSYQWYRNDILLPGATEASYVASKEGEYAVVVTNAAGCQSEKSKKKVTVYPLPLKPVVSVEGQATVCYGTVVKLTSSSLSGNQWFKDNEAIEDEEGQVIYVRESGKYRVAVVNLNGCSEISDFVEVIVKPLTVAPSIITAGSTTVCFGETVTLTSSQVSGNQWYKDGVLLVGETGQTYTATASGKYTVTYVDNGCVSAVSAFVEVTIKAMPTAPIVSASGSTTVCFGETVTLTSSQVSGNQWYKDGALLVGETGQTYTATASGKYTVTYIDNGCVSAVSAFVEVTIKAIPVAASITASGSTTVCFGETVTLTSSQSSGNQWYKDGVLLVGETGQTYTATASGKHTVTYVDNGCVSAVSAFVEVTIKTIPVAASITASGSTTVCFGETVTLTSSQPSGNQWYKDGVLLTGETGQTYTATASGKYTVTYVDNGCVSAVSAFVEVTIKAVPVATSITASGSTTVCFGETVTLTSSQPSGNQWYKDGVLLVGETGQTYTATASGKYTVTYVDNGCVSAVSAFVEVTIKAVPVAASITASGSTTVCFGETVTLTSSQVSGNQWYKDGVLLTGETGQTYTATASGKYTVTYVDNGCVSAVSAFVEVTIKAIPTAPVVSASGSTTVCFGETVTLTSSQVSGNQWYKDGVLLVGETGQTYTATASGKYTVTYVDNGCVSAVSAFVEVTIKAIPTAPIVSASGSTTVCFGETVTLTSSQSSGNQWYKDGVLLVGETGQTYTATASGKYTVTYVDNGCVSAVSAFVEVTIKAMPTAPVVSASGSTTVCFGETVTLTSSQPSGNQWYKDGVLLTGETGQTYTATASGKYTVTYVDNGCVSAASAFVEVTIKAVPTAPVVSASGSTTVCFGETVILTSSQPSGNQWYKDGVLLVGETGQTYTATASGKYTVTYVDNGCVSAVSAFVEVTIKAMPTAPVVSASGSMTVCFGQTVTLTSSQVSGNQWYKDGVLLTGETGQTYTATASGKYTVTYVDNGCVSAVSAFVEVTIKTIPVAASITASGSTTVCFGQTVILTSSQVSGNQWYKDGVLLTGETGQTYTATASGKYTVTYVDNGCVSAASAFVEVTIKAVPVAASITASGSTTVCFGETVTLISSQVSGNQWYKDGVLLVGETGQTYTATASGKYTVSYLDNGCISAISSELSVIVFPLPPVPTIAVASQPVFCEGGSVLLTSSATIGNQWYKDGVAINDATAKTYTATASGSYSVIVTNANQCVSLASLPVIVTVYPNPAIPEISPANATTFCDGGAVLLTSSASSGNQWYKNGTVISGATNQTYNATEIGVYTVKTTNTTGCSSVISASTTVTVNPVPKGFDDDSNVLTCTISSFSYDLQTNINNLSRGGNGVPASFTWTVNSTNIIGAENGSGSTIHANLINTGTTTQDVVYTVTPKALTAGCEGRPFKVIVRVPVCLGLSIDKVADRHAISKVGDQIKYTITVKNTGNANHNNVVVNDPLTGGNLSNPTGDNHNNILEKGETWTYERTYTVTQFDLDQNGVPTTNSGNIRNTATVKSTELPVVTSATADVAILLNPVITLVKTGVFNTDFKTITYTFKITNKGNVTLSRLELTDPKLPAPLTLPIASLAPGGSVSISANYTVTEAEKVNGTVSNTATVKGFTETGTEVTDVSGTTDQNDVPTVVDVIRYPAAIDDFAKTTSDVEVAVPVAKNDRASLFPLDVTAIELKSQPMNGTLQLHADGKVIYKPNKGFFGTERFTYKINDTHGLPSNVAVVVINVVPPDLEIPNTFTPNGDGKNDTFQIKGRENYDSLELSIFNRWGDQVYRNNNYKDEWDGNGLNEGTYFYVLKLKKAGKEETRRSWILLKR